MPLVRIDLLEGKSEQYRGDLGNTLKGTTSPKFWQGTPQDEVPIEVLGG